MFDFFWLFFVVVFRSAEAPRAIEPANELDFLFENDECARGGIMPC